MSTFAPPVRRGDFLYSSVLYADPGNANHHARASVAEIAALLRPEAPNLYSKSKKPAPATPAKDPVWHWYAAQLIHYGLPTTKDKNVAKVRLLNHLNEFKLEVPAWILKVEGDLKREWEEENRRLKKGTVGVGAGKKGGKEMVGKGAKGGSGAGGAGQGLMSNQGINVNVNVSVSSGMAMVEQLGVPQAGARAKKPSPGKRKRDDDAPKGKPTPKKAANASKPKSTTASQSPAPAKKTTAKKTQTPARTISTSNLPSPTAPAIPTTKGRTAQTARKTATKTPLIKKETAPSSTSRAQPRVKEEADAEDHRMPTHRVKREYSSPDPFQGPPTIALSGTYSINIDATSSDIDMTVYRDHNRNIWWASFELDSREVTIKMDPGPSFETLGQAVTLGWRTLDRYYDEAKFGTGCTGRMTFSKDHRVDGVLRGMPGFGDLRFWGRRLEGPTESRDLQEEWDEVRRLAYG